MTIVAPVREPSVEIVEVRTLEQWRQDLLAAADWLEANKWCQNSWVDDDGARCAAGAIEAVTTDHDYDLPHMWLETFVCRARGSSDVESYNDTPGRTKDEVIATMRACAMQP